MIFEPAAHGIHRTGITLPTFTIKVEVVVVVGFGSFECFKLIVQNSCCNEFW